MTDPNRLYIKTTTGDVQAWEPVNAGTAVSASFLVRCGVNHGAYNHFMTIAAARSLADALRKAADHAEELLTRKAA